MSRSTGYYCLIHTFFGCILLFATSNGKRWTAEDESRRIMELKKEEKRLFEKEMGQPLISQESEENPPFDYGSERRWQQSLQPSSLAYSSSVPNRRPRPAPPEVAYPPAVLNTSSNWCFHCTSPWNAISSEMRQVVRNLLEVRRSAYPNQEVASSYCTNPRDKLDSLMRQPCLYSYCQTLILTDHETGSAFTLRGCAESFGAIDPSILSKRDDNTCKRLHDNIDIQECICKERKYCYTGPERKIHYTERLGKFNLPLMQKKYGNSAKNLYSRSQSVFGILSYLASILVALILANIII